MKYLVAKIAKDKIDRETGEVLDTFWTKIGAAFPSKSGGGYSVVLDALPPDGKFLLVEPLPDDEKGDRPARRGSGRASGTSDRAASRGNDRGTDRNRDDEGDRNRERDDDTRGRGRARR